MGCGCEQGSCESSSRKETEGDGPHRRQLLTKRSATTPLFPSGYGRRFLLARLGKI